MTNFTPGPVHNAARVFVHQSDPRYSVRPEWVLCRDGVHRYQYRGYCNDRAIGELMPCFKRDVAMAELQELIDDGGIGSMTDLPNPKEDSGDAE